MLLIHTSCFPSCLPQCLLPCVMNSFKLLCLEYSQFQVRFICDVEEQKRIFQSCHYNPTSGHFRINKTMNRISESFIWPGLTLDVTKMVCLFTIINSYSCRESHCFVPCCMLRLHPVICVKEVAER